MWVTESEPASQSRSRKYIATLRVVGFLEYDHRDVHEMSMATSKIRHTLSGARLRLGSGSRAHGHHGEMMTIIFNRRWRYSLRERCQNNPVNQKSEGLQMKYIESNEGIS